MKVSFTQVYIEVGINFPFTQRFQRLLSAEVTRFITPSDLFLKKYGPECNLDFYVSAKKGLSNNQVAGPGIYKKSHKVEYTIFLPFDPICKDRDVNRRALHFLFQGIYEVFGLLAMESEQLKAHQDSIVAQVFSLDGMFK